VRAPREPAVAAVFTQGSVLRHVIVMTLTSGAGLMAVFLVDVLSMFYISFAQRDDWRAAVSLMSKAMFFPYAVNLGLMVGLGTVVSVAVGSGDRSLARRYAATGLVVTALVGLIISLGALPWRVDILRLFGAQGEALEVASRLLALTLPVNVLLSVGMGCASIVRAWGDPQRAMLVSVAGAIATAIADPVFIFGLRQGVDGVGWAIIVARIVFVAVALWAAVGVHDAVAAPRLPRRSDIAPFAAVAVPAIATNLALPFADWFVTRTIWQFGVAASAAAGVYDRIMPFAFSLVIALSGAIGPIVGQNFGAGAFARVRLAFLHSLMLAAGYGVAVWLVVSAGAPLLVHAFGLSGGAATFFAFLCRYATLTWVFVGCMLVANAMFNTLGRAYVATLFTWGRATLGTIPFVLLGVAYGGAQFAMIGIAVAALLFALTAVLTADRLTRRLRRGSSTTDAAAFEPRGTLDVPIVLAADQ
jgi:Na+-driven multidrug efflux pump